MQGVFTTSVLLSDVFTIAIFSEGFFWFTKQNGETKLVKVNYQLFKIYLKGHRPDSVACVVVLGLKYLSHTEFTVVQSNVKKLKYFKCRLF